MRTCPECGCEDVGEVTFSTVGSGVEFFFCRYCEHRWWVSGEGLKDLDEVLDAAKSFARTS